MSATGVRASYLQALSVQEAAYHDFTAQAIIRAAVEVTETTPNTKQTFGLGALPVGTVLERAVASLAYGFQDKSDVAFNTTKLTVKIVDGAGADKTVIFTALELNMWGTVIAGDQVFKTPTNPAVAGDKLVAELTGMAAKSLSALDQGEVGLYFDFNEPLWLNEAGALGAKGPSGLSLMQTATLTGRTPEEVAEAWKRDAEAEAKAQEEAEAKAKGEKGNGNGNGARGKPKNYDDYTVAELKEQARKRGVEVSSDARKDEIIDALEEADKEGR